MLLSISKFSIGSLREQLSTDCSEKTNESKGFLALSDSGITIPTKIEWLKDNIFLIPSRNFF